MLITSHQHKRKLGDEKSVIEKEYALYKKESNKKKTTEEEITKTSGNISRNTIRYDTKYTIETFDAQTNTTIKNDENLPSMYIGLERSELEKELALYNKAPSLRDKEQGFESAMLLNFSQEEIIVRKVFSLPEPDYYYLAVKENFIIVYEDDQDTIYMNTSIALEELPVDLQIEIMNMKFMETEEEVYNFLESHSS